MRIRVHIHLQMLPVTATNYQTNYRTGCCVSVMYSTFGLPSLSCVKFQNTLSALYSERVAVQVGNAL